MNAAEMVWAREQKVLAHGEIAGTAFAEDFVSFAPNGNALDGEQFTALLRSARLSADDARLMWCEQGQKDSYCLAFRVPEADGRLTTHMSLWRYQKDEWRKQFHIFVEGEDSF
ncbi:hypothetical protein [Maritalea sp. S77]|uniref:hypothetical protein n=1 Tax=Maritalea sp. S77 TaxID=3415125 RepID=UPI003C7D8094